MKIDLKKELKGLYSAPSGEPVEVIVPAFKFLMIDGAGDPNTCPEYQDAVEALYAMAYGLKFAVKKAADADYVVMPLEGLWWADDMSSFTEGRKSEWSWTAMIMQPDPVTPGLFKDVMSQTSEKKDLPALERIRLDTIEEGACAQIMHAGPYSAEGPNIQKLHGFITGSGHSLAGKHHEIYLSDPRRSAPEKMKTIIRQPFK